MNSPIKLIFIIVIILITHEHLASQVINNYGQNVRTGHANQYIINKKYLEPSVDNAYISFPVSIDNPVWMQTNYYLSGTQTVIYCLHGDTLINAEIFQKIYLISDTVFNEGQSFYYGAIQDEGGLVSIVYANSEQKNILFDFTVNEGDTVWLNANYMCRNIEYPINYVVIDDIDTVEISGNVYRQFYVTDGFHTNKWIESIGNDGELFCPVTILTDDGFLNSSISCLKIDNVIIYPENNSTCFQNITAGIEKEIEHDIYINVDNSVLKIANESDQHINRIEIFTISGYPVLLKEINSTGDLEIPIENLESSLYFVRIRYNSDDHLIKKIINQ